ncbi:hypothetical protein [Wenzhouxiangella limi]|uniref:Uncharacterized protein n=1 Tax=Wenzhouxiangella limi TaxID=2707351 RepID=A0A845UYH2_9GAMM|nr:hypothetical protein [Wenzhouxiangella limi]NDY95302.1 hypothetical protein [Wenzhouxiangella limi]
MSEGCDVAVSPGDGLELDPTRRFAVVSSAGVVSSALMRQAREVCVFSAGPLSAVAAEWFWDGGWMSGFRARVRAMACSVLDEKSGAPVDRALQRLTPWQPAVSLVSSVFKADRFLDHFLDNCAGLTGYREMEHWLVRPGSPGDEHGVLLAHARSWPGAVYLNLAQDPGLYATWNLACCLARGRYLSNANVDDRRHPQQVRRLRSALDERPGVDLASAALRVTAVDNQDWDDWADGRVFFAEYSETEYSGPDLVREVGGTPASVQYPALHAAVATGLAWLARFFQRGAVRPLGRLGVLAALRRWR